MFDLGWQEFILIALVAVVVVGPKDLPRVIRSVGQWIRKARSLASEFQGSLEEMAREAELDDVRKQVQQVSREGIGASIERHVDPDGDIRRSVEDARTSSGATDIEAAFDEARRDTQALASARDDAGQAEPGKSAPGDPVTPPAARSGTRAGAAKALAKRAGKPAAAGSAAAPAKPAKASEKAAAAKPAAAKPRRTTTRKPAAGDAGKG